MNTRNTHRSQASCFHFKVHTLDLQDRDIASSTLLLHHCLRTSLPVRGYLHLSTTTLAFDILLSIDCMDALHVQRPCHCLLV